MPHQKMNGFAYETKPVLLDSRGLFYWFVLNNVKAIYYEPCVGYYAITPLKRSRSELVLRLMKVTEAQLISELANARPNATSSEKPTLRNCMRITLSVSSKWSEMCDRNRAFE